MAKAREVLFRDAVGLVLETWVSTHLSDLRLLDPRFAAFRLSDSCLACVAGALGRGSLLRGLLGRGLPCREY